MIITVTMNPSIDKTIDIVHLEHGGLNRISHVERDAGGKGINVSKTIRELGGESIATGFIGGNSGRYIEEQLKEQGIRCDFVEVEGETRTNTKVHESTGEVTELNEPGPEISEEKLEALFTKISGMLNEETLLALAGSVPAGVKKDIYARLTKIAHEKGAAVLMDADGELFVQALDAAPDMIKPNREELEEYLHADYRFDEGELVRAAERLMEKGIGTVVVSMGAKGALFLDRDLKLMCPGLTVKAHSTVGAGDAMVAAMAYAWDQKLTKEERAEICMATSAGAVTTIGTKPPTRAVIDELAGQVKVNYIK